MHDTRAMVQQLGGNCHQTHFLGATILHLGTGSCLWNNRATLRNTAQTHQILCSTLRRCIHFSGEMREIDSPPRHSVLFDGRCRSTAYSISACGSDLRQLQTKQIRSPKADGNMLAIRVKTAEVQRITTPLPLLLAFLVASHITEVEGVLPVISAFTNREDYRGCGGSP
ncbi:hypothetical protein HDV62DRAFT_328571 [Trichoderma sp. SZMC 28011]